VPAQCDSFTRACTCYILQPQFARRAGVCARSRARACVCSDAAGEMSSGVDSKVRGREREGDVSIEVTSRCGKGVGCQQSGVGAIGIGMRAIPPTLQRSVPAPPRCATGPSRGGKERHAGIKAIAGSVRAMPAPAAVICLRSLLPWLNGIPCRPGSKAQAQDFRSRTSGSESKAQNLWLGISSLKALAQELRPRSAG
jgi:hypothetical protein